MVFVDSKSTSDQAGTEDGSIEEDQLPECWVVVAEDLEFGIEVEVEVDESTKGSSGMSRWHRFQRVIDLVLVTPTNISLKHDLAKASAASQQQRRIWVADG